MKKIIFFAALFILAACATPTPQVTVTPEATLTAPPTDTPAPTASPQPEISAEVQAKFDQSEIYSINQKGQIEMTVDGTKQVVEDLKFDQAGNLTFTHEEQTLQVDAKMFKIVGERIIFRDTRPDEQKTWIFDRNGLRISEYIAPEAQGFVTYEETLSGVDFEINPKADEEAVYNNFISLLPNSLKKTEWNQTILDRVLEKTGLTIVANASNREKRIEFMQAFLEESGGIIDIYNPLNQETLEGVDLNLPVVHKSKETSTMPERFFKVNQYYEEFVGGNIVMIENGQIEIILVHSPNIIDFMTDFYKKDNWTIDITESIHFHFFLEMFGFGSKKDSYSYFTGNVISDPRVYIIGENAFQNNDPSAFRVKSPGAGFLKTK